MKSRLWGVLSLCCGIIVSLSGSPAYGQVGNQPPDAYAGPDLLVFSGDSIVLTDATASDPTPTSTFITYWSQIAGDVTVTFSPEGSSSFESFDLHPLVLTPVSATAGGFATLELQVYDGEYITKDTMELTIMPAAVPVPPAVWLFGSGLVGLMGVARRRNTQI